MGAALREGRGMQAEKSRGGAGEKATAHIHKETGLCGAGRRKHRQARNRQRGSCLRLAARLVAAGLSKGGAQGSKPEAPGPAGRLPLAT